MILFSSKYAKKEIIKDNVVQLMLYVTAYPMSKLFSKLNISPNMITLGSLLFSVLAFASLVFHFNSNYFMIFWGLSVHLDCCDGTVARMTGRFNQTAFDFDHMGDIFKISLVIIGASIMYNTFCIWILTVIALFLFLYSMILNHEYSYYKKSIPLKIKINKPIQGKKIPQSTLVSLIKKSVLVRNIFTIFATLNGHTLVFFFLLPFGNVVFEIFLIYFCILTLTKAIQLIRILINSPKLT